MKKYRYILLFLLVLVPFSIQAVSTGIVMGEVERAIADKNWEQVEKCFRKVVAEDAEEAELFFWKKIANDTPCRATMALILGEYNKNLRSYNKAYVFYNELIKLEPDNIAYLSACAEMKSNSGKEEEALSLYERVLSLDTNNLPANIFVGNYYYYYAEKERTTIKNNFARLSVPTRMEYARYRESLNRLVISDYAKAKSYLQRVISQFPSLEIKKVLDKIHLVEVENAR